MAGKNLATIVCIMRSVVLATVIWLVTVTGASADLVTHSLNPYPAVIGEPLTLTLFPAPSVQKITVYMGREDRVQGTGNTGRGEGTFVVPADYQGGGGG